MVRIISWTHIAESQLHEAFLDFLDQCQSLEITSRIFAELYESTNILATNPEIYELDQLYANNTGNVRAYVKHNYRISYLVEKECIYIIRVRYARKEPLLYSY